MYCVLIFATFNMDTAFRTFVTVASLAGNTSSPLNNLQNVSFQNISSVISSNCPELVPEDANLSFLQLASKYGYPGKQYKTITEDGYILTVFRINGNTQNTSALPILLMHGLLDSSDTWILRGKESLSINLAERGYDIWLGNIRGNRYSPDHISATVASDPAKYWNFTFHEHGKYDLAATIDLVLQETGAKKLNAIGHSQGTTVFWVLCSTRPEYNEKINVFTALAPIAFLQNNPPPVSTLIQIAPILIGILRSLNVNEVLAEQSFIRQALKLICPLPVVGYTTCAFGLIFPFIGYDPEELGPCFLKVLIRHYPQPTSVKNINHFVQVSLSKRFAQYDYGEAGNIIAYNSATSPEYDLSKITTRVVLIAGRNDFLSTLKDVDILKQQLPNVVSYRIVPRPLCNHFDFVVGKNMDEYIQPDIYDVLLTYGSN